MRQRLPLVLSALALVVALLGTTPLASAVANVVPYARKAEFAQRAAVAANAKAVGGHKASVEPTPGQIPVIDAAGKLPESLGAVGPKGDPGEPATRLWAVIKADGTRVASSGVVSATGTRPYVLTFAQDVSKCAIVATPGAPNPQVVATAFATGAKVEVHIVLRSNGASTTDGFSLAAFC